MVFPWGGCEEGLQRGRGVELSPERNGCRDDWIQMTRLILGDQFSNSEGSWEHEATMSALRVMQVGGGVTEWGRPI